MEDLRIRTTKNMIHQALMRLLKSKPLEKITVVELCKQAQVNRSTFYKYYGSQYDVLEDIVQNLFHQLGEFSVKSQSGPQKMIFSKEMLAFLLEHKQLCQTLLDCVPSPYFQNKLLNILQYDDSFSKNSQTSIPRSRRESFSLTISTAASASCPIGCIRKPPCRWINCSM